MKNIYIKARGKINLILNILDKREDNYHNLESIFQKISLYDELYIKKISSNSLKLKTNIIELENDSNIIYKAYQLLKNRYPNIGGVEVSLKKNIPMQAGLAGGSTDCASFILGMNQLFNLNLNKEELVQLGKKLGADVVPCYYNTALKAEGIGEIITKISTDVKYYILIIKPDISCNTKEMFQKLDKQNRKNKEYNLDSMVDALKNHDINTISNSLYNAFEEVIEDSEKIKTIKNDLIKVGAMGSLMTGSGSCVYGIFDQKEKVKSAYRSIKDKYKTYFCIAYNSKRKSVL